MRKTWLAYDAIANIYEFDMGMNMPFDDVGYYARHAAGEVLELGCGTGRITRGLVKTGLPVTAVDSSARMIRRLWEMRAGLRQDEAQRVSVVLMDLRDWALRGQFSTILCPYSLFTYFVEPHEYDSVLDSIHRCLRPNGQFLLDVFIPRPQISFGQTVKDYRRDLPDGTLLTRSKVIAPDAVNGVHNIFRHYERSRGLSPVESFTTTERIRTWYPDALEALLVQHSFDVIARDFNYGGPTSATSAQFVTFRCRAAA